MEIAAAELKNKPGKYLDISRVEPVAVDKTGRKTAVLLSMRNTNAWPNWKTHTGRRRPSRQSSMENQEPHDSKELR
jgi:hypothetical protein